MQPSIRRLVALVVLVSSANALSAQTAAPRLRSTSVQADRTVIFRFRDPAAQAVTLAIDGQPKPFPMAKDADGVWTVTSPPLAPEIYGYHFTADGQARLDPANANVTSNLLNLSNLLTVPGDGPEPWEPQAIPHGELRRHTYTTSAVTGLPANQSEFFVYTPPGYDPRGKVRYPVLYLLHGWSDRADGWTAVGQAHRILDSLLAQGKIRPMLAVMPLGYGEMSFVSGESAVWSDPAVGDRNVAQFGQALLTEVLPRVEAEYTVSARREDRAIAGLSMGGLESLEVGLTHTDKFAYVGGFSSALTGFDAAAKLGSVTPKSANLRLLWIACGTEDRLIEPNRRLIGYLKEHQFVVTPIETPGMHTWPVWRDNLLHFAPLLFTSSK